MNQVLFKKFSSSILLIYLMDPPNLEDSIKEVETDEFRNLDRFDKNYIVTRLEEKIGYTLNPDQYKFFSNNDQGLLIFK